MTIGIYGIFDAATEECLYVGLSIDIERRWGKHINLLKNGKHRDEFVEWFKTHNNEISSMNFNVLETCENIEFILNSLEIKWFNILRPKFSGKIPSDKEKWKHSEETKAKISTSSKSKLPLKLHFYICVICENGFKSKRLNKKFCSLECLTIKRRKEAFGGFLPEVSDIIKRYELHETSTSIAESYNVSYMTILKILRDEGIEIRQAGSRLKRILEDIECLICDKTFTPVSKKSKTCSNSCRSKLGNPGVKT